MLVKLLLGRDTVALLSYKFLQMAFRLAAATGKRHSRELRHVSRSIVTMGTYTYYGISTTLTYLLKLCVEVIQNCVKGLQPTSMWQYTSHLS